MSTIEGGLRDRFIEEALYRTVRDGLEALGWFDDNRWHEPIHLIQRPLKPNESVELNTINVVNASIGGDDIELGSNLSEDRHVKWIDVYGESDAFSTHVAGDIKDILRGKMPSIGRAAAVLEVFDYRDEPDVDSVEPDPIFVVDVDRVITEHARSSSNEWERFWYSVQVELVDEH